MSIPHFNLQLISPSSPPHPFLIPPLRVQGDTCIISGLLQSSLLTVCKATSNPVSRSLCDPAGAHPSLVSCVFPLIQA